MDRETDKKNWTDKQTDRWTDGQTKSFVELPVTAKMSCFYALFSLLKSTNIFGDIKLTFWPANSIQLFVACAGIYKALVQPAIQ